MCLKGNKDLWKVYLCIDGDLQYSGNISIQLCRDMVKTGGGNHKQTEKNMNK